MSMNNNSLQSEVRAINADASLSQEEKSRRIHALYQRNIQVAQAQQEQARRNAAAGRTCAHYKRNCDIETPCCNSWYSCRLCHDELETTHQLDRRTTQLMRCRLCQTVQPVAKACRNPGCSWKDTRYFCEPCRLWEDDERKQIFHCLGCGICRVGKREGYWHCDNCGLCIKVGLSRESHKCQKDASKETCVCGEFMHTSTRNVGTLPCGHSLHVECELELLRTNPLAACPKCRKSIRRSRALEQVMQLEVNQNPMPPEFQRKCEILCNDCQEHTVTNVHWLGVRCLKCGSFNTSILATWIKGERPQEEAREILRPEFEEEPTGEMDADEEEDEEEGDEEDVEEEDEDADEDYEHVGEDVIYEDDDDLDLD